MGMTGMEAVVKGVYTVLSAGWAAKVTALNTEYGAGITLASPGDYAYYDKSFSAEELPGVTIQGLESPADEAKYRNGQVERHRVYVEVTQQGDDIENLEFELMRYARLVKEVLMANFSLSGVCHGMSIISTQYSPVLTDNQGRYLKATRVILDFFKEETL